MPQILNANGNQLGDPMRGNSIVDSARNFDAKASQWITQNPVVSMLVAAGVGAGLGWVFKTRP